MASSVSMKTDLAYSLKCCVFWKVLQILSLALILVGDDFSALLLLGQILLGSLLPQSLSSVSVQIWLNCACRVLFRGIPFSVLNFPLPKVHISPGYYLLSLNVSVPCFQGV